MKKPLPRTMWLTATTFCLLSFTLGTAAADPNRPHLEGVPSEDCNGVVARVIAMDYWVCADGDTCFSGGVVEVEVYVSGATICSASASACSGNVKVTITLFGSWNDICTTRGAGPHAVCSGNIVIVNPQYGAEGNRVCNVHHEDSDAWASAMLQTLAESAGLPQGQPEGDTP